MDIKCCNNHKDTQNPCNPDYQDEKQNRKCGGNIKNTDGITNDHISHKTIYNKKDLAPEQCHTSVYILRTIL